MSGATLFRPEALHGAAASPYGTVLLARPVSHAALALLAAACIAALLALLAGTSYVRKAQVSGVLLPARGVTRLVPGQPGVVQERRAREGQAVRAGDVLFVVASARATAGGASAEAAIAALLQARRDSLARDAEALGEQFRARRAAGGARAVQLAAEAARIEAQAALQGERIALARAALQRHVELQAAGFVSAGRVQEQQAELLDQRQRLADQQRALGATRRELAAVQAELQERAVQARRDALRVEREHAALEQEAIENAARREVVVRAPHDGILAAVVAEPGQPVTAQQALASLLPAGSELEAELYAPAPAAGFVRPGMAVRLRLRAYPYQKFGMAEGHVREVSETAVRPDEMPLPHVAAAAAPGHEPLYRVRVALARQSVITDGHERALKPGASVDASVLLDRRRLLEWVLDPLHTLAGRL